MSAPFTRTPHPAPTPDARRAEIVADPGFGRYFTDHMVTIRWTAERGWHDAAVVPYGPLSLDPATMVLHYGQEIFEGLKAYRQPDGSIASFRPEANAARFRGSAARLAMAELPDELFLASLQELVGADREWVPPAGGEESLYLRPFMLATEVGLGVRPVRRVPVRADRVPGRPVLHRRAEVDRRVAEHRVHPVRAGRHRHGQVRRQLRRLAAPAGPGRRARLRPGRLPGRRGAALDRRDGLEQPVLRVRLRRPGRGGHAHADRQHPGRGHPRLAAGAGQGAGLPGGRAPDLRARSGWPERPTARSPRCSAAAPPR